jgi:hypothetical protein
MPTRTVAFGSAEYFALAADSQVAQWLSLSPEMMLVLDGAAVRVTTQAGEGEEIPATPQPVADDTAESSFWQWIVESVKSIFGD